MAAVAAESAALRQQRLGRGAGVCQVEHVGLGEQPLHLVRQFLAQRRDLLSFHRERTEEHHEEAHFIAPGIPC